MSAIKAQPVVPAFRIELAGYSHTADSLAAIAAWVADIKTVSPDVIGKEARVTVGERLPGGGVHYKTGAPTKLVVVSVS